jgi:hypothetical protein
MVRVSPQVPYTPKDILVKKINDSSALLKKEKKTIFIKIYIKKEEKKNSPLLYPCCLPQWPKVHTH